MKILLVGAELFHADRRDGRTDRNKEANGCSSQFFECAQQQAGVQEYKHITGGCEGDCLVTITGNCGGRKVCSEYDKEQVSV